MSSIYYNPDAHGVTIIASLDQGYAYDFDMLLFVQRQRDRLNSGVVFALTDQGCSCYTPFDGKTLDDGVPCASMDDVDRVVAGWWDTDASVKLGDVLDCKRKVREALR